MKTNNEAIHIILLNQLVFKCKQQSQDKIVTDAKGLHHSHKQAKQTKSHLIQKTISIYLNMQLHNYLPLNNSTKRVSTTNVVKVHNYHLPMKTIPKIYSSDHGIVLPPKTSCLQ